MTCPAYFRVPLVSCVSNYGSRAVDTKRPWFDCPCVHADRIALFWPFSVPASTASGGRAGGPAIGALHRHERGRHVAKDGAQRRLSSR